ncbi:DUF1707 domain-containing protein [Nocardioides sp. zg-1308]|uniref:DUF1707 SHOCT-like domain-containing protein n=1 Tax=Nocardioides sp. zg-1308 TaxID=2736253 RepID=UPI0015516974|nr:DUF1707 domain-containing protein [Nocardioides sp. zg-1308]NPD05579.1 DUF1707 domain-containing protein [Nocardioides sp. zg-1308]
MRGFRAKDADRDRFVELIEAAYVDGQLGAEDRDLRVSRALTAETLDELQTLTRDLQLPEGHVPPAAPSRTPVRVLSRPSSGARGVLVGLVVFVVLVAVGVTGVVALAMFAVSGGPDATTSTVVDPAPAVPGQDPAIGQPGPPSFELTPAGVRGLLRDYEAEFGTLDAFETGLYPEHAWAFVPVRGARPRYERWSFDGAWSRQSDASAVRDGSPVIDLGALDVRRLFANIDTAQKTLDVPRGELTHVLVNSWMEARPSVNIYVANRFDESGYLRTTLAGDVVRAYPYGG